MTEHMHFENRVVVFLDILGFASLVEDAAKNSDSPAAKRLAKALSIIQNLKLHLPDEADIGDSASAIAQADLQIQIFSDSVIISIKQSEASILGLLRELCQLYIRLMAQGVWIRGGITYGKISHDRESPCGPAINGAYRLESQIADIPRIVLGQSIVNLCKTDAPDIFEGGLIQRDDGDGVYALSPILFATQDPLVDPFGIKTMALEIALHLNQSLEEIVDQPQHFRKIKALSDIWNFQVNPKNGFFEKDFRTMGYVDFVDMIEKGLDQALEGREIDGGTFDIESLPKG